LPVSGEATNRDRSSRSSAFGEERRWIRERGEGEEGLGERREEAKSKLGRLREKRSPRRFAADLGEDGEIRVKGASEDGNFETVWKYLWKGKGGAEEGCTGPGAIGSCGFGLSSYGYTWRSCCSREIARI